MLCSNPECIRRVSAHHNRCQVPDCESVSCDLCSGIFLEKLISDGLLPPGLHDLNSTMGRAAFRICLQHAQEDCSTWTASFQAANEDMLKEISEWHKGAFDEPDVEEELSSFLNDELRCLTFLNKINGADRSLFKVSVRIPELVDTFPETSFGRKRSCRCVYNHTLDNHTS